MSKRQTSKVKTDNDYMADKVGMRISHLPDGLVTVLDCFAGSGRIWRGVKRRAPDRDIRVLAMDRRNIGFHLPGDNVSWLQEIDLTMFNVVDLDAYGVPYDQMKILFDRGYKGTVFVTFIQTGYGQMSYGFLQDLGFSYEMIRKTPTIFRARGWQYIREWLAIKGVDRVYYRYKESTRGGGRSNKYYFTFKMK